MNKLKNELLKQTNINFMINFVFQFIKNTKWHFGYTGSPVPVTLLMEVRASENFKSTFFIKPYHTTAFGTPFLNNLSD